MSLSISTNVFSAAVSLVVLKRRSFLPPLGPRGIDTGPSRFTCEFNVHVRLVCVRVHVRVCACVRACLCDL
jgi:hypothetical protein